MLAKLPLNQRNTRVRRRHRETFKKRGRQDDKTSLSLPFYVHDERKSGKKRRTTRIKSVGK